MKFGSVNLFTDPMFYAKTVIRVVLFHTTPLGFFLMAIGIVRPPGRLSAYLFHVWLAAVLVYFPSRRTASTSGTISTPFPLFRPVRRWPAGA